jgi:hypothetical protein
MLIELVTPLMLTTMPVKLSEPPNTIYDHASQKSILEKGSEFQQMAQSRTTSFNGTQTYASNGRPNDADSDRD